MTGPGMGAGWPCCAPGGAIYAGGEGFIVTIQLSALLYKLSIKQLNVSYLIVLVVVRFYLNAATYNKKCDSQHLL